MSNSGGTSAVVAAVVGIAAAVAVGVLHSQITDPPPDSSQNETKEPKRKSGEETVFEQIGGAVVSACDWVADGIGRIFGCENPHGKDSVRHTLGVLTEEQERVNAQFCRACDHVAANINEFSLQDQLYFYGCYKQATVGDCVQINGSKFSIPGRGNMKVESWSSFRGLSQEAVACLYVERLIKLVPKIKSHILGEFDLLAESEGLSSPCGGPRVASFGAAVVGGARWASTLGTLSGEIDDEEEEKLEEIAREAGGTFSGDDLRSLSTAINKNEIVSVQQIIEANPGLATAPLDLENTTGLHIAADRGHLEIVKLLCSAGADVKARDDGGDTALHNAVVAEQTAVFEFLLSVGGDPGLKNSEGEDCFMLAKQSDAQDIGAILESISDATAVSGAAALLAPFPMSESCGATDFESAEEDSPQQ